MQDPLGMVWCPYCKDNTSNRHTSSSKLICNACGKDKIAYRSPYDLSKSIVKMLPRR